MLVDINVVLLWLTALVELGIAAHYLFMAYNLRQANVKKRDKIAAAMVVLFLVSAIDRISGSAYVVPAYVGGLQHPYPYFYIRVIIRLALLISLMYLHYRLTFNNYATSRNTQQDNRSIPEDRKSG